jgi:hypothetical protein
MTPRHSPPHPLPTSREPLPALINQLRGLIESARKQALRAVDSIQVRTCWEIGRHIVEFEQQGQDRAEYGSRLLPGLAQTLTKEFGRGFDASNLRYMRLFYQAFPKCDALRHELSWTHYRALLRVDSEAARQWYMNEAAEQNWSTRALDRQIGTLYYERLLASRDHDPVRKEAAAQIAPLQKTPREFVRELTHQDIGQLDMYVRMVDDLKRAPDDNPTVSIILCASKDTSVVRYSVLHENEQLFASKYKLILPSEDELRAELEKEQLWLAEQKEVRGKDVL